MEKTAFPSGLASPRLCLAWAPMLWGFPAPHWMSLKCPHFLTQGIDAAGRKQEGTNLLTWPPRPFLPVSLEGERREFSHPPLSDCCAHQVLLSSQLQFHHLNPTAHGVFVGRETNWPISGKVKVKVCSVMSGSLRPHGLYSPWNPPGQNTGVGSLSPAQGIFPTQGSNPHYRRILYQLSHQGSPRRHIYYHKIS